MSVLRVNKISSVTSTPVVFSQGVILPAEQSITPTNFFINTSGIVTASSFGGVGAGITTFGFQNEIRKSKVVALSLII